LLLKPLLLKPLLLQLLLLLLLGLRCGLLLGVCCLDRCLSEPFDVWCISLGDQV
jgi:hypothetical protein